MPPKEARTSNSRARRRESSSRTAASPGSRPRAERSAPSGSSWPPVCGHASFAATAGFDLPVTRERRFMFFTEPAPSFPAELPLTIDFSTGFHFHREGPGLAFGGRRSHWRSSRRSRRGACRRSRRSAFGRAGGATELSRPQRPRRRCRGPGRPELRDGLLRARLPAGPGGRRAPRRAARSAVRRRSTSSSFSVERFAGGDVRVELNVV